MEATGRQVGMDPVCSESCLIDCHPHRGRLGGLCCDLALSRGPVFLQEHKAIGRGSEKLAGQGSQDIFPVAGACLRGGEGRKMSLCVRRPQRWAHFKSIILPDLLAHASL